MATFNHTISNYKRRYICHAVRLGKLQRFDPVVQGNREHLGFARDIAPDHQYHAEFTHSVREAEAGGGQETVPTAWQYHTEPAVGSRCPQAGCGIQQANGKRPTRFKRF